MANRAGLRVIIHSRMNVLEVPEAFSKQQTWLAERSKRPNFQIVLLPVLQWWLVSGGLWLISLALKEQNLQVMES